MKTLHTFILVWLISTLGFAQTGSLDLSFNPGSSTNDEVLTTSVQGDGKIIIGGKFTAFNGTEIKYVARLNIDGSLDASFDSGTGASHTVFATAVQSDGKIIIGGDFISYNGTEVKHIARLNTDGSLDLSFDPGAGPSIQWQQNTVYTISLQDDGKIIIGGNFAYYDGTERNRIARLNPDGSIDATFNPGTGVTGMDSRVRTSSVQSDGKIIIGGDFFAYNSELRNCIARLNADGSLDTTFDPGMGVAGTTSAQIYTTSVQGDGKVIIGGWFYTYNGMFRNCIARLNADGSLDPSFETGADPVPLQAFKIHATAIQSDGRIIIAGTILVYDDTVINRVARLNDDGSIDSTFDPEAGPNSSVKTILLQSDGKIIIGGWFQSYSGNEIYNVARINTLPVGIDQLEQQNGNIKIFPNPFSSSTTLQTEFELRDAALTIFNASGQAIEHLTNISGNTVILNRDNLPTGLYFIRLLQDDQIITTDKLIVTDW